MKKGVRVALLATVFLFIAAGAWYFWYLAPPLIPEETQDLMVAFCEAQSKDYGAYTRAVLANDSILCEQARTFKRVCIAKVKRDSTVCDNADLHLQNTCRALAANDPSLCKDDSLCAALLGDIQKCSTAGFTRFACEAAIRGDQAYFTSGRAREDCIDSVKYEEIGESENRRACKSLRNPVLREECIASLTS